MSAVLKESLAQKDKGSNKPKDLEPQPQMMHMPPGNQVEPKHILAESAPVAQV